MCRLHVRVKENKSAWNPKQQPAHVDANEFLTAINCALNIIFSALHFQKKQGIYFINLELGSLMRHNVIAQKEETTES